MTRHMPLSELRERLEKASGPDRALDGLIAVLGGWEWHGDGDAERHNKFAGHWVKPGYPTNGSFGKRGPGLCDCNYIDDVFGNDKDCPRSTESLDAIVSLIQRKLPRYRWLLKYYSHGTYASVFPPGERCDDRQLGGSAMLKTPAFSLSLAFVKAMEAQANEDAKDNGERV